MDGYIRRWMAVFFAILVASSLVVTPVLASAPDRTTDVELQRGSTSDVSGAAHPMAFGPPDRGDGPPGHDRGDLGEPVDVPELAANTSIETNERDDEASTAAGERSTVEQEF